MEVVEEVGQSTAAEGFQPQPIVTPQTPVSLEFIGVSLALLITLGSVIGTLIKIVSQANEIKHEFAITDRDIKNSLKAMEEKAEIRLNIINQQILSQQESGRALNRRVRGIENFLGKTGYEARDDP